MNSNPGVAPPHFQITKTVNGKTASIRATTGSQTERAGKSVFSPPTDLDVELGFWRENRTATRTE